MFTNLLSMLSNNQFNTSIWGDEGFSAILSSKPYPELIKIIAHDTSPPLYNITEKLVFLTFGTSEIAIRGLSFFYYLLTIFFVSKIALHIWGKKTSIWAALLTFFNPFFFIYAFEGRMYSILALGVTASMYFFMTKKWKSYVVATAWALYSHHFAIFALFVQGIWTLYELVTGNKERFKKRIKAFIAVGIIYIPWIFPLYNQTKMVGGGFWLGTPTLEDLKKLIYEYLAQGIKNNSLVIPFWNKPIYEVSLILVFVALAMRKWHKTIKDTVFLLLWFLGPILITWGVSQYFQSIFYNRYLLYAIPSAMLIVASKGRKYSEFVIGALLLTFVIVDANYFTHPTKLPFKEMSAYVKSTRENGDYLINWNSSAHHLWETKYYGIDAPIYIPNGGDLPYFVGTALMEPSDIIRNIPEGVDRVGVVTSGSFEEINLPSYTEETRKEMNGLKFVWYQKKQSNDVVK